MTTRAGAPVLKRPGTDGRVEELLGLDRGAGGGGTGPGASWTRSCSPRPMSSRVARAGHGRAGGEGGRQRQPTLTCDSVGVRHEHLLPSRCLSGIFFMTGDSREYIFLARGSWSDANSNCPRSSWCEDEALAIFLAVKFSDTVS